MKDEKTIVIDINLTRGLVGLLALALLVAACVGYLAWGQGEVAASSPQAPLASSAGMRGYYLTKTEYNGAGALTACAAGYHFASLWEITDPSNLKYNTSLGNTRADSGQGPPSGWAGWVRTGYSSMSSGDAGVANCTAWTSPSSSDWGTYAGLPSNWTSEVIQTFHVWGVGNWQCNRPKYVWCVED